MQPGKQYINTHAVAEPSASGAPLYTIITARRPWPVGNGGKRKSARVYLANKLTQNINGKHYNGKHMMECAEPHRFLK